MCEEFEKILQHLNKIFTKSSQNLNDKIKKMQKMQFLVKKNEEF